VSEGTSARDRIAVGLATAVLVAAGFSLALAEPRLGLLGLVSGLPLALCRLRAGREASLVAALAAAVLVGAFFSPGQGLGLLLVIAAPALIMGEALAAQQGILTAAVRSGALLGLEVALGLLLAGPEMADQLRAPLRHYQSEAFGNEMRQERGLPEEQLVELQQQFASLESALAVVYPAAWLLLGWTVTLVLAALLRLWLARRGPRWLEGPGFEDLRLPIAVVAAFLVAGVAVLSPPLRPPAYNALLVAGFLFGLQGLSVAVFYTNRMPGPRPLRAAIVVLMLLIPLGAQILALAGLFDNFFDFRRWAKPPQAGSGTAEGDDSARG
jgi:uncharacterized protein YybS (DUF2232 family)